MSEQMPGEIWIGGPVREAAVSDLCCAIGQASVALDWGDNYFEPHSAAELLAARTDYKGRVVLRLCDDQALMGEFHELEACLQRLGIPYDRQSDGNDEFDPLQQLYRPGFEIVEQLTDHSGNPTTRTEPLYDVAAQLATALSKLHQGEWHDAQSVLEGAYHKLHEQLPVVPPLPAFEIAAGDT